MRRLFLIAPFALLTGFALLISCADSPPAPEPVLPANVEKIADGVWFRLGDMAQGHCNNVIIELSDGLLIVDANFPSGAKALMEDLKTISTKPVKYVFDTHHHGDHAYANALWTAAGATTLAFTGVAEEMARYEPGRWRQAMQDRPDVAAVGDDTVQPPQETFSDTPHVLADSMRRVEMHHFGWAHTRGDGFVYLPELKILCTGDAIVNGPYNYTGDGNTGNWPDVVEKALGLDFEHVLPGHGPHGGREIPEGQKALFEFINTAVDEAVDAGKKLADVVTVEDGKGVATTIVAPAAVKNWVGDGFPEQIRVRWAEIEAGKPHGEILGGE